MTINQVILNRKQVILDFYGHFVAVTNYGTGTLVATDGRKAAKNRGLGAGYRFEQDYFRANQLPSKEPRLVKT